MTAKECITGRRSIRKFTSEPISHEVLQSVVETASYAPSWKNTQITRYIAVEDPELKSNIAKKATAAHPNNANIINSAPVLIVVTMIKNRSGFERDGSYSTHRGEGWQMFDAGVASEAFCLAAYDKGLGTVIMGIIDDEKIAALLNVPEGREVVAVIPVGYPAESPVAPKRKPVEEMVTYMS